MFKSGDTIQALEAGTWYDAKIIERMDQELEAYKIHYKGYNKRYDCVKYAREIRQPEVLITDPVIPTLSPKAQAKTEVIQKLKAGRPAKKGTHVKKAPNPIKSPKKVAKKAPVKKGAKIQDPTISTSKINLKTPGEIETQMLRQIKQQLETAGSGKKFGREKLRRQYRKQIQVFTDSFAQHHVQRLLKEPSSDDEDDDVMDWEDYLMV